jgi:hypothetical protein
MHGPKGNCLNSFNIKHFVSSEMIIPWTENATHTMTVRASVVACLNGINQTKLLECAHANEDQGVPSIALGNFHT